MVINLISSPRNISTALMYSFAQRKDTKVIDEPFYAYYLKKSGADHPGKAEIIDSMPSCFDEILNQIDFFSKSHKIVFLKNMAHHLIDMNLGFLLQYQNIFLIRDPGELIHSFSRVIPEPQMSDIGSELQYEIYEFLKEHQECPVIDSNSILENPEIGIKTLCDAVGIPFDKCMLTWKQGPIPEDGIWAKYWYNKVHSSTGFFKRPLDRKVELNEKNFRLYTEAIPYYTSLKKNDILR